MPPVLAPTPVSTRTTVVPAALSARAGSARLASAPMPPRARRVSPCAGTSASASTSCPTRATAVPVAPPARAGPVSRGSALPSPARRDSPIVRRPAPASTSPRMPLTAARATSTARVPAVPVPQRSPARAAFACRRPATRVSPTAPAVSNAPTCDRPEQLWSLWHGLPERGVHQWRLCRVDHDPGHARCPGRWRG